MPILTIWINGGKDADEETIEKVLDLVLYWSDGMISKEDISVKDGGEVLRMSDGLRSWEGVRGDFILLAGLRAERERNGKEAR